LETIAEDFKQITKKFLDVYSKNKAPIEVNFRELVNNIKFQDRATHSIHTYPAKLLPNIPYFFLNNSFFIKENEYILDPFSGSGTVLLEALLSNKNAFGSDSNPLARLISEVKTTEYDIDLLKKLSSSLKKEICINSEESIKNFPEVVNIDYWFLPSVKHQLAQILERIKSISSKKYKDFFLLCFSNCIKKVSLADPRISVPVKIKVAKESHSHSFVKETNTRLKGLETLNVIEKFFEIVNDNIDRFESKEQLCKSSVKAKIVSNDARKLKIRNETVDLIISSPPYAGAQKYIRACSLNLGWTELSSIEKLRELDKENIGRENYSKEEYKNLKVTGIEEADNLLKEIFEINPIRAHIAGNYLAEMKQAIKEAVRVLKKDKYLILIAANNRVCNKEFKTQEYLRQIAEMEGMETKCVLIDDIKSYGLMTKRNKTASIITCEWVLILKKL
jgi:DNA modification methylase